MEELIFAVDENNIPVSPAARAQLREAGGWARVAHLWIINKARVLSQLRPRSKDINPGLWEPVVAEHLLAGENAKDAAIRGAKEEYKLIVDDSQVHEFKKGVAYPDIANKRYVYLFYTFWGGEAGDLVIQKDEIDKVELVDLNEIRKIFSVEHNAWSSLAYESDIIELIERIENEI